jgi:hypothetical protein
MQSEGIAARKLSVGNLFVMSELGACIRLAAKFLLPRATFCLFCDSVSFRNICLNS